VQREAVGTLALAALLVLSSCGGTDRPEGVPTPSALV